MSPQREDPAEIRHDLGPLFNPPLNHLSGRTDPETSRDAAKRAEPRIGNLQRWALDLVRRYPGQSCPELATWATKESNFPGPYEREHERVRQACGRRLNELEKAGLIRRDGTRDGCSLWWPVTP